MAPKLLGKRVVLRSSPVVNYSNIVSPAVTETLGVTENS